MCIRDRTCITRIIPVLFGSLVPSSHWLWYCSPFLPKHGFTLDQCKMAGLVLLYVRVHSVIQTDLTWLHFAEAVFFTKWRQSRPWCKLFQLALLQYSFFPQWFRTKPAVSLRCTWNLMQYYCLVSSAPSMSLCFLPLSVLERQWALLQVDLVFLVGCSPFSVYEVNYAYEKIFYTCSYKNIWENARNIWGNPGKH